MCRLLRVLTVLLLVVVAAGCGDEPGADEETTAALDELAASVEMSTRGLIEAMSGVIWRESDDGVMEVWLGTDPSWEKAAGWRIVEASTHEGEQFTIVKDGVEATWVLASTQFRSVPQEQVEEGFFPPDPPDGWQMVSSILGLDLAASQGLFRIDCETEAGDPAVALVLASDDEQPIARSWTMFGPLQYVPTSEVTCG